MEGCYLQSARAEKRQALATALLAVACAPAPRPATPPARVERVAGVGAAGYDGEGLPARESALDTPVDVAFDGQGRPLVLDWLNQRIRAIDAAGRLVTVVGTGSEDYGELNVPAARFPVHHPLDVAVTAGGELLIAGYHDPRVLRVGSDGLVRAFAGFGAKGDAGDGGPATLAFLEAPSAVARAASGESYVADELHHRVRKVTAGGVIEAFAGTGARGYGGDGGPATSATLNGPMCLAVDDRAGAVYVCDTGNHAIRRVDRDGTIRTIAGTGEPGGDGDGGPALDAQLYRPFDLALLDGGGLLVADSENHRIRRIDPDGTIDTLVGTSTRGAAGEGGPARELSLSTPWGIAIDRDGSLWIADSGNHRLLRAEPSLLEERP